MYSSFKTHSVYIQHITYQLLQLFYNFNEKNRLTCGICVLFPHPVSPTTTKVWYFSKTYKMWLRLLKMGNFCLCACIVCDKCRLNTKFVDSTKAPSSLRSKKLDDVSGLMNLGLKSALITIYDVIQGCPKWHSSLRAKNARSLFWLSLQFFFSFSTFFLWIKTLKTHLWCTLWTWPHLLRPITGQESTIVIWWLFLQFFF